MIRAYSLGFGKIAETVKIHISEQLVGSRIIDIHFDGFLQSSKCALLVFLVVAEVDCFINQIIVSVRTSGVYGCVADRIRWFAIITDKACANQINERDAAARLFDFIDMSVVPTTKDVDATDNLKLEELNSLIYDELLC